MEVLMRAILTEITKLKENKRLLKVLVKDIQKVILNLTKIN